jgi:hypothetical protein
LLKNCDAYIIGPVTLFNLGFFNYFEKNNHGLDQLS